MSSLALAPFVACSTCMTNAGDATTNAAAGAILVMLALLVMVFGGIFQFIRHLGRCANGEGTGGQP